MTNNVKTAMTNTQDVFTNCKLGRSVKNLAEIPTLHTITCISLFLIGQSQRCKVGGKPRLRGQISKRIIRYSKQTTQQKCTIYTQVS